MVITWYRKLFCVNIQYETAGLPSATGLRLEPSPSTLVLFDLQKIRYRVNPGQIEVFVPGMQNGSLTGIDPLYPMEINELMFFTLSFNDAGLPGKLIMFPDPASQVLGFPTLFTGNKETALPGPVALKYEKTKVLPGAGSCTVNASDAGLDAITYAPYFIKNISGQTVAGGNAMQSDGFFTCSWDMHLYAPGFFILEIGSKSDQIFLDTRSEFTATIILIQITRTGFLTYPTDLSDTNFVNFTHTIQKL